MRLIGACSDALVPGLTRRLLLAVLATLAPAVAASPAGAAGHSTPSVTARPNVGIVNIYTTLGYQHGLAAGTGMIISRSGEALTNNHVINGATKFNVADVTSHRRYTATVAGYSVSRDIAVLQLASMQGLHSMCVAAPILVEQLETLERQKGAPRKPNRKKPPKDRK